MDEYISKTLLLKAINTDIAIPHNERCAQLLEAILNAPKVNVREVTYAEWYYDPNGMDWGLGAWKCSKCHTKNDNFLSSLRSRYEDRRRKRRQNDVSF